MQTFISLKRQGNQSANLNTKCGLSKPRYGGAERDRTADPLLAKQVLSQLSYSPNPINPKAGELKETRTQPQATGNPQHTKAPGSNMVGPGRLELPTPRLSSVCSNRLSYGPIRVGTTR